MAPLLVQRIRSLLTSTATTSLLDWFLDPTLSPHPLALTASPGLITLLDTALYQSREGELTSTVCSSHVLLVALLELKRQSGRLLREVTQNGRLYEHHHAGPGGGGTTCSTTGSSSSSIARTTQQHPPLLLVQVPRQQVKPLQFPRPKRRNPTSWPN